MSFLDKNIEKYVEDFAPKENDLLAELNRETHLKVMKPNMLSGYYQGRLLSMLSKMHRPKNILEIGTYTGYSALCLAEGLVDDGKIITIDRNKELVDMQDRYFEASPYREQIHQVCGNALKIIPDLNERFDVVFIDADKQNYANYFDQIIEKMAPSGIILSDNVLWKGKITDPDKNDKQTAALKNYNEKLAADKRVESLILPIRDGITLSRVI